MKGIVKDISDEVIDLSHSLILKVKIYFTCEAYQLLTSKGMYNTESITSKQILNINRLISHFHFSTRETTTMEVCYMWS